MPSDRCKERIELKFSWNIRKYCHHKKFFSKIPYLYNSLKSYRCWFILSIEKCMRSKTCSCQTFRGFYTVLELRSCFMQKRTIYFDNNWRNFVFSKQLFSTLNKHNHDWFVTQCYNFICFKHQFVSVAKMIFLVNLFTIQFLNGYVRMFEREAFY